MCNRNIPQTLYFIATCMIDIAFVFPSFAIFKHSFCMYRNYHTVIFLNFQNIFQKSSISSFSNQKAAEAVQINLKLFEMQMD